MKKQNLRIVIVAAASLIAGSWLTGVFGQQESPPAAPASKPAIAPSTAPAAEVSTTIAAPATSPAAVSPATVPAAHPSESGSSRYGSGSSRYGRSRESESRGESSATRPSATPDVAAVTIPPSKPIDKKYEILLSRSLFSKERPRPPVDYSQRPATPPSTVIAPPPPPAPEKSMAVRGLSIEGEGEDDDAFYAFIEDLPLKVIRRVKVGEKVARGVIVEITLADLVYELEGKRTRVLIGHTLDGAPAPAVSWTTYTPVATAPLPASSGSRGGDPRGGDSRGGDSRGGEPRGSESRESRGGESRGGPPSAGPVPSTPTPETPAATAEAATAPPATAPAAGAPDAGGGDDLLERMRKRREQEGGR